MPLLIIFLAIACIVGADPIAFLRPGYKYPTINENPQFNNCRLVEDQKHPTGSYYKCTEK